jgi:hypothetical protein
MPQWYDGTTAKRYKGMMAQWYDGMMNNINVFSSVQFNSSY